MENYTLKQNETILFRGTAFLMPDGKEPKKQEECDVLLTNMNIVFICKIKKLFRTEHQVDVFSVNDVKIYDETIQIIRRKSIVDIYFKQGEVFADFKKEKFAKEFCDKALRLISGFSKLVRSVKKTQKAINETNEALDIDVVDIAKKAAILTCEVTTGVAGISGAGKTTKFMGRVAGTILGKVKKKEPQKLSDGKEAVEQEQKNPETEETNP